MNKYFTMRKKALESEIADLDARAASSESATEVRALGEQRKAKVAELDAINAELEERAEGPVNGQIVGAFSAKAPEVRSEADPHGTMEYRQAFRKYILTGEMAPELRAASTTADTAPAIPSTVLNEVINTVKTEYGTLYRKVRKLSVPGGVQIPVGNLEASFKWINESTVSPRQKLAVGSVIFNYHVAELRIAISFLASLVTIDAFEAKFAEVIARAYLKAMDYGIINGSGNGTMLGILNDASVTATVTMTAAQMGNWAEWKKRVFKAIPMGYKGGEFIFADSTVTEYLETLADSNNHPVFKDGMDGTIMDGDRLFGKPVSRVAADVIEDFDTASSNDVIGLYWIPSDYGINENFAMTTRRYFDEETNEWVSKAITVVDGKVINPTGFIKILKG